MDFTLKKYKQYLEEIQNNRIPFILYREYMSSDKHLDSFCLIRHDVDRKVKNALDMARLEASMGIVATYYFRAKPNTFKPKIIKQIEALGHEIGYHYESLSDTYGDIDKAVIDFEINLNKFREIANIDTCSMHGRPLKPFDNRDIWKSKKNHDYLVNKLGLLGEVYLDIDYSDIAYINDTGRNWTSGKSNVRDKVDSLIPADFSSSEELMNYLKKELHPKLVFQIHPERWSNNKPQWYKQAVKDSLINVIKKVFRIWR